MIFSLLLMECTEINFYEIGNAPSYKELEDYFISCVPSSVNDWVYINVLSLNKAMYKVNKIKNIIYICTLLLVIEGFDQQQSQIESIKTYINTHYCNISFTLQAVADISDMSLANLSYYNNKSPL
jgi:hypothetical protein